MKAPAVIEEMSRIPRWTNIQQMESMFCRQAGFYPESDVAIHERWTHVMRAFPELIERSLTDSLDDIYERGMTLTGNRLFFALDLVRLQNRFYVYLAANRMILRHIAEYNIIHLDVWEQRLNARWHATRGWRRTPRGYVLEPRDAKEDRRWLN